MSIILSFIKRMGMFGVVTRLVIAIVDLAFVGLIIAGLAMAPH